MLKKWIDEIRTQPDLYKSECWKYHLSGNVIELSILPEYLKKKKLYRCSVIAVGQVLQALSKKIEGKQLNFHIQSFPNLESPEIVATIRMDQEGSFSDHSGSEQHKMNNKKETITEPLNKLVDLYHFSLKKIEHPSQAELNEDISFEKHKNWFLVYSTHNNPFTWLNVGYLKESLRNQYSLSSDDYLSIFDLCSLHMDQYTDVKLANNEYLQFLVGIQSANVSAG